MHPPGWLREHALSFDSASPGLWRWSHYFDLYEEHFAHLVDTDAGVLEVGVFSGGGLKLWRDYFGPAARLYGADISPNVTAYDGNPLYGSPRMFVGAQSDPDFWERVRSEAPQIDLIIDDASHIGRDQLAMFREMWPHIRPGGVYWIEDLHPPVNYMTPPAMARFSQNITFMRNVRSMTFHKGIVVLHKEARDVPAVAMRRGGRWQSDSFWQSGGAEQRVG